MRCSGMVGLTAPRFVDGVEEAEDEEGEAEGDHGRFFWASL